MKLDWRNLPGNKYTLRVFKEMLTGEYVRNTNLKSDKKGGVAQEYEVVYDRQYAIETTCKQFMPTLASDITKDEWLAFFEEVYEVLHPQEKTLEANCIEKDEDIGKSINATAPKATTNRRKATDKTTK